MVINRRVNRYGRVYDAWSVLREYDNKKLQEPYKISIFAQDGLSYNFYMEEVEKITQEDINTMAKLTGYIQVAGIVQGLKTYYYAIYNDGHKYKSGDNVIVSGRAYGSPLTIRDILSPEEASELMDKDICEEVIGYIDMSSYEERVRNRERAANLRKMMDKKIEEMNKDSKYEMYAEKNPELKAMLEEYKKITV